MNIMALLVTLFDVGEPTNSDLITNSEYAHPELSE